MLIQYTHYHYIYYYTYDPIFIDLCITVYKLRLNLMNWYEARVCPWVLFRAADGFGCGQSIHPTGILQWIWCKTKHLFLLLEQCVGTSKACQYLLQWLSCLLLRVLDPLRTVVLNSSPGARFSREVQPTLSLNLPSFRLQNSWIVLVYSTLSRLTLSLARAPRLWKVMISGAPKLRFTMATAPAKKTSARILPSMRNFNS